MKRIGMALVAVTLALMMVGPVLATGKGYRANVPMKESQGQPQGQPQDEVPGSGQQLDHDKEFKKNPEKYPEKMNSKGVTPEKSPAAASQSGK